MKTQKGALPYCISPVACTDSNTIISHHIISKALGDPRTEALGALLLSCRHTGRLYSARFCRSALNDRKRSTTNISQTSWRFLGASYTALHRTLHYLGLGRVGKAGRFTAAHPKPALHPTERLSATATNPFPPQTVPPPGGEKLHDKLSDIVTDLDDGIGSWGVP